MRLFLKGFLEDQSGATSIEYALIVLLISVTIIGGATSVGTSIDNTFTNASGNF